jgi:hypothetical protein
MTMLHSIESNRAANNIALRRRLLISAVSPQGDTKIADAD